MQGRTNFQNDRILTIKNAGSSRIFSVKTFAFILVILFFTASVLLRYFGDGMLTLSTSISILRWRELFPFRRSHVLASYLKSFWITFSKVLLVLPTDIRVDSILSFLDIPISLPNNTQLDESNLRRESANFNCGATNPSLVSGRKANMHTIKIRFIFREDNNLNDVLNLFQTEYYGQPSGEVGHKWKYKKAQ